MKLIWGEELKNLGTPYAKRWVLDLGIFALRLHSWYEGGLGKQEIKHSHAWPFVTFVLRGGYTDVSDARKEHLQAPAVRYRPADHAHYVHVDDDGCLSLVVSSKAVEEVYYFCENGWRWTQGQYHWIRDNEDKDPCED